MYSYPLTYVLLSLESNCSPSEIIGDISHYRRKILRTVLFLQLVLLNVFLQPVFRLYCFFVSN